MRQAQKQITAGVALSQANEASWVLDIQVVVMPMLVLVRLVAFVRTLRVDFYTLIFITKTLGEMMASGLRRPCG